MTRFDIDGLARIALLFLSGDDLEHVLVDRRLYTDYRFDEFNRLKAVLTKVERLEPNLDVSAILWRLFPGNPYLAEPLIAGNALPNTSWWRTASNEPMRKAGLDGENTVYEWKGRGVSHYYPVRNGDEDIVGVLELLAGRNERADVASSDMFVERAEED